MGLAGRHCSAKQPVRRQTLLGSRGALAFSYRRGWCLGADHRVDQHLGDQHLGDQHLGEGRVLPWQTPASQVIDPVL